MLTDTQIKRAKTASDSKFLSDGLGLYLRVRPSGSKVWLYRYKSESKKTHWHELGTYPQMGLAAARAASQAAKALRRQGGDPVTEYKIKRASEIKSQAAEIAAIAARKSVNELFNSWQLLALSNHKDGGKEIRRMFEKDVLPHIGLLPVEEVRKAHIVEVINRLLTRNVPRLAKMILALIRQMFRFAIDQDVTETDPTASIRKAKIGGKDTERERVLSEREIKALSLALRTAGLSKTTEAAIWISLSTGCRIGELLKAQWADIDLEKGVWIIPSENSKNGLALSIQLSQFSIKQFNALKAINTGTWCYPNRKGTGHVCVKTVTKQIGDRQILDSRIPMSKRSKKASALKLSGGKWTPHDLRRTAGTLMTALGVLPDIADRCLNHKEQNRIRRTYLRHDYSSEMKEAWSLLGERLELLCSEAECCFDENGS